MPSRSNLNGLGVLVTRPAHQAGPLCDRISAAGGRPLRFPLLNILDTSAAPAALSLLKRLTDFDIAIFISPNAVLHGGNAILRLGGFPDRLKLATVGRGSARELEKLIGRPPDIVPQQRYDSEGLLALEALQHVAGKRILILRGNGGRELLADQLRERGASVDYAEVYRREMPDASMAEPGWLEKTDVITVTSSEALQNLVTLTPAERRDELFNKALIVVSERAAQLARELGFTLPAQLSRQAGDEAILEALTVWASNASTLDE